jgi:signal transduction histidine kinase/ligand-binding sensor domain-containing protein
MIMDNPFSKCWITPLSRSWRVCLVTLLVPMLVHSGLTTDQDSPTFTFIQVDSIYSETIIQSITEGDEGMIWIGTVDGLCYFDGYDYRFYRKDPDNPQSLSTNAIRTITEDFHGNLWIGTQRGGLNKFNKRQETAKVFLSETREGGFISESVWASVLDQKGRLWLGTWNHGLLSCLPSSDGELEVFTHYAPDPNDPKALSHPTIRHLYCDRDGIIWVGTQGGGLCRLDPETGEFTTYRHDANDPKSIPGDGVNAIVQDAHGQIWVGTNGGGLCKLNEETQTFTRFFDANRDEITALIEIHPGLLLIGTGNGLHTFDTKTSSFDIARQMVDMGGKSIHSAYVRNFYKDKKGIIWIGTENGVYRQVYYKSFTRVQNEIVGGSPLKESIVRSITEDANGNIWLGTIGKGLNRYNRTSGEWSHFDHTNSQLQDDSITALEYDPEGRLWVGSLNGFLHLYDSEVDGFESFHLDKNPINFPNIVQCIVDGGDGYLWIGTENGIIRFNKTDHTWKIFRNDPEDPESLPGNNVQSLAVVFDPEGNLWIGTYGTGVSWIPKSELDKDKIRAIQLKTTLQEKGSTLPSDFVISIHFADEGIIWFGTYGDGLIRFDPSTGDSAVIDSDSGLSNNVVYAILEDDQGFLWCSTQNGLNRVDPKSMEVKTYSIRDGLHNNAFFWGAAHQNEDGEMFFGGQQGFSHFIPRQILDDSSPPALILTDIEIVGKEKDFGQAIYTLNKITLEPEENFFTIHYSALDFVDPPRNQYRYQLEGIDRAWVDAGNRTTATYTNIPPGEYEFKVVGSNSDGIWNLDGKTLTVRVLPTLYQTWYFKAGIVALIAALALWFFHLRIRRVEIHRSLLKKVVDEQTTELRDANEKLESQNQELEMHQNKLELLVSERTAELESAKNRAELADRLKTSFLANMSHEVRTPLNAIVGFSYLLNEGSASPEEKQEYLDTIDKNTNMLLLLVDDILDFSKMEAGELDINILPFKVDPFLQDIVSTWKAEQTNAKVEMVYKNETDDPDLVILSDQYRLKQILNNLIGNAFKFTKSGYVELTLEIEENTLKFSVKDTGIGIAQQHLNSIFDRFFKVEESTDILYRGSGLGLSISKRLSELLQGRLSATSKIGSGSTFTLNLPNSSVSYAETELVQVSRVKSAELAMDRDWKSYSILIAEDEETNFQFLKSALKRTGASIVWAQDGQTALEFINKGTKFDIVLMDIKMPRMDGIEALKAIRQKRPNQVVIAQTAYATNEDKIEIDEAGFDAYLSKPIHPLELYRLLEEFLEGSK